MGMLTMVIMVIPMYQIRMIVVGKNRGSAFLYPESFSI